MVINLIKLRRHEVLRVVFPSLLTVVLFVVAVFGVFLPIYKNDLIRQKKALINKEVQTVFSILQYYDLRAESGEFTLKMAQDSAIKQIRVLRYGIEGKDYFWINDTQPKMIMHPYRPDLEGQDMSDYSDPAGKHIFKESVELVKKDGAGYMEYHWQRKDEQNNIVPKISCVMLYKPWGWIIGTGVYIEDIRAEIEKITKQLGAVSVGILLLVILLSVYVIRNSLKETNKRLDAEKGLQSYKDNLENLVEKRTAELKEAISNVKILNGFLPICASCKKIRDDKGCWNQIESYIKEHSEAEFSHSICPECVKKLYPEFNKKTAGT